MLSLIYSIQYKRSTHMSDILPLACQIQDPAQLRQRTTEVQTLFKQAMQMSELTDGYAFCFPDEDRLATQLLEFIQFEKNCCPFFTFELAFEAQHGPIWLRLRGPDGVKAVISEEFL